MTSTMISDFGMNNFIKFDKQMILQKKGGHVGKHELITEFTIWVKKNKYRNNINREQIFQHMNKKYGEYNERDGWKNIAIAYCKDDYDS
jgi:hypothetical protein